MALIFIRIAVFIFIVPLFIISYYSISLLIERNINDKIRANLEELNKNYEKRLLTLKYKQFITSSKKKKSYLNKLDILIQKSNVRNKISILTSEVVVIIGGLLGVTAGVGMFYVLYSVLASITIMIAVFKIPELILHIIANRNAKKVDDYLVTFLGTLQNLCYIKDDIVFAITNSVPYLKEPLKSYCNKFALSVRYGEDLQVALQDLSDKVDNNKFKMFIKNLQLCSKYNGSYTNVIRETKATLKDYQKERGKRHKVVVRTRSTLLGLILICVSIIFGLFSMNPQLGVAIRTQLIGQMILVYNIIAVLVALFKLVTLEKFDY